MSPTARGLAKPLQAQAQPSASCRRVFWPRSEQARACACATDGGCRSRWSEDTADRPTCEEVSYVKTAASRGALSNKREAPSLDPRSWFFLLDPTKPMAHCRSERTKGAFLSQCDGKPKRRGSPARVLRTRRAKVQASGRGGRSRRKACSFRKKKQVYILGLRFQAGFCNDHWVVGPLSKTMRARRSSLEGVIGRGR